MKTSHATLEKIKTDYPAAFAALPKGWRFLNNGEKIREDDKCWIFGEGPYGIWPSRIGQEMGRSFYPYIRQIKLKITPLPEKLKNTMPQGYVYLGKGGEFKVPDNDTDYYSIFICCSVTTVKDYQYWGRTWERAMVSCSDTYYAFPIDSEIARLNGVKPKINSLLKENEALKKELADLKAKVAAFVKEVGE